MVPFDQVVVTALILIEHLLTSLELSLMHVNVPLSGCQQFDLSRNRLPEAESYSYGQFKGYLFSELSMSPQGFMDEFQEKVSKSSTTTKTKRRESSAKMVTSGQHSFHFGSPGMRFIPIPKYIRRLASRAAIAESLIGYP